MKINTKLSHAKCRSQQGIVLIVTLLVLTAMVLATVTIMRQTHTAQNTTATVTLRSSGNAYTMPPIEAAIKQLAQLYATDAGRKTLEGTGASMTGYSATYLNDDNNKGIPRRLLVSAPQNLLVFNDEKIQAATDQPTLNCAYVLVERMCKTTGEPDRRTCVGSKPFHTGEQNKNNETSIALGNVFSAFKASYRISVRVESPGQAVSFAQAIIQL